MAAPPNLSAATATVITGLPADLTQTVHDAGTTYTVWYQYTATAAETWIGVWASGDPVTYRPRLTPWLGPASAPVDYLGIQSALNMPIQIPVETGTTYYFKIAPFTVNGTPAVLTLSILRGPQAAVPVGALAIPDDSDGLPLVFLDAGTGAVLNIQRGFPAGEAGDVLPTGEIAIANTYADQIAVYDAARQPIGAPLPFAGVDGGFGFIRAHPAGRFYVGDITTGQIRTVTAAAAFGPLTWTTGATALRALAVNLAETRAYYADSADNTTKIWNLTTNASAGPFLAFPAGYTATDLIVLTDDTLLIAYSETGGSGDATQVVHYRADASVLHTYDFPGLVKPLGTPSRIATALEDPGSFWIWTHHPGGLSHFRRIRVSDGTAITTLQTTEFELAASEADVSASPVRFGHSFSCPFFVLRGPGPPTFPPIPPGRIRRVRRAPHLSAEQVTQFFARFSLDLEAGVGNAADPGADPQVYLRWSDDGGHTWRAPLAVSAGTVGAFRRRAIWRRLGRSRDRVFEVSMSDPVKWALLAASLDAGKGTS